MDASTDDIKNYFHIFYGNADGKNKEIIIPGKNNIEIKKGENLPPFDDTNVDKSVDYLVESIRNRIDESKKKSYDVYDTLISQSKSQESILMNTAQYIKERRGANLVNIDDGTPEGQNFLKRELEAHSKGLDTFQTVITQQELQYHTLMVSEILKEIDAYKNGVFSSNVKTQITDIENKCTDLQKALVSSQNPTKSVDGIFDKKSAGGGGTDLKKALGTAKFGNIVDNELKALEDGVMNERDGKGEIEKFFGKNVDVHGQNRNVKVFLNSLKTLLLNIQKRTHSYDYVQKAISKAQGILDLAIVEDADAGAGSVLTGDVKDYAQYAIDAVKTVLEEEKKAITEDTAAERAQAAQDAEKFKYVAKARLAATAAVEAYVTAAEAAVAAPRAVVAAAARARAAGVVVAAALREAAQDANKAANEATAAAREAVTAANEAADARKNVSDTILEEKKAADAAQVAETKAQEAVQAAQQAGVVPPIVVPKKNAVVVDALRTLVAELETGLSFTDNQNILTLLTRVDAEDVKIVTTAQITGQLVPATFTKNIIENILLPFKNIVKKMYKHKQELLQKANIARYVEKDMIKANKLVSDAYTIFDIPLLTTEDPLLQDIIQLGKLSGLITYYYQNNIANGNLNTNEYLKNDTRQTLRTAAIAIKPPPDATHFIIVGDTKLGTYDIENIVIQPFYDAQIKFMGYCENQKQLLDMFSEDMKKRASMVGAKSKIEEGYIYGETTYYPLTEYVKNLSRDMDVPQMYAVEQTKINTAFISGSKEPNDYKFGTITFPVKNDTPIFIIKDKFKVAKVEEKKYNLDKKTVDDIKTIISIGEPKNTPLLTNIIQDAKKSRISTFIELVESNDNKYIDSQYNHIKDLFIEYISDPESNPLIKQVDEASVKKWVIKVKETYFNQLDTIIAKDPMEANDKILVQEYIRNLETKIPVLLIHNMFEYKENFDLDDMFQKISPSQ